MNLDVRKKVSFKMISCQGDSLSDDGRFYGRGIGRVVHGVGAINLGANFRFTNGLTWHDHTVANLIAETNPNIDKKRISKNYAQGGATSGSTASYMNKFENQTILDRIDCQRMALLKDYANDGTDLKDVLFIEWSGANDLVTINNPNFRSVKNAVNSRIANLKELIGKGGDKFILFNLPDLSETPRYKKYENDDQWDKFEEAKRVTESFNKRLYGEVSKVKKKYPEALIEIFDVHTKYRKYLKDQQSHQCSVNYEIKVESPRLPLQNNVIYLVLNHANSQLEYTVLDPCGQLSAKSIPFEELAISKQLWSKEKSDELKNLILDINFKKILLRKTGENGDTISDILTPIVETEAYKRYINKKQKNGERVYIIPCPNSLFWDDVHPTSKVHEFLAKEFTHYLGSIANFEPNDWIDQNKKISPHPLSLKKPRAFLKSAVNDYLKLDDHEYGYFFRSLSIKHKSREILSAKRKFLTLVTSHKPFMNLLDDRFIDKNITQRKLAKAASFFRSSIVRKQAIRLVVLQNKPEYLDRLEDNGVKINIVLWGIPLIHESIAYRLEKSFRALLSRDGWDSSDAEGNTILHCILQNNWLAGYEIFMEEKKNIGLDALINQTNVKGETAISIAAEKKQIEMVAEWIARPNIDLTNISTESQKKIIYRLAQGGKASLLENLLLFGGCQPEIRKLLLKQINGTVNSKYYTQIRKKTALMVAAQYGHGDVVKVLLEAGADVFKSVDGWTALDYTWYSTNEQSSYQVIKRAKFGELKRNLRSDELKNALVFCCEKKEDLKALTLIKTKMTSIVQPKERMKDAKITRQTGTYYDELKKIILNSKTLTTNSKNNLYTELLIKWVDLFEKDMLSEMFNWLIANSFFTEALKVLEKGGFDVNMEDSSGKTAIDLALLSDNNENFLETLLKSGGDPNHQDNLGQTPLYRARNVKQIHLLVAHGADISNKDSQGRTAYDYHSNSWRRDGKLALCLKKYEITLNSDMIEVL